MDSISKKKLLISVLGYWSTGKTSIISSYFGYHFDENIIPTRGIDCHNDTSFNKNYMFKIYDTTGGEKYRSISRTTIVGADGYLLVFALDFRESFEEVKYWLESIKELVDINKKSIIIVGNKSDIDKREISYEEAYNYANENKLKYFETSAKSGNNIKELFNELYMDVCTKNKICIKK